MVTEIMSRRQRLIGKGMNDAIMRSFGSRIEPPIEAQRMGHSALEAGIWGQHPFGMRASKLARIGRPRIIDA